MFRKAHARRGVMLTVAVAALAWLLASSVEAAQTVHLTLEIDGNTIEGESTISSMDRQNTIECSSFSWGAFVPTDPASATPSGERRYEPVKVIKRIDKSTPLLAKALTMGQPVTAAEFRFYRPDTEGSGAEVHFYTILLENGYITGISALSEDAIVGGANAPPMMETVSFVFQKITWTYEIGGVVHEDNLRVR